MNKIIRKYDERGNLIYEKFSSGFKVWRKFDKDNRVIYLKVSTGHEVWFKYERNKRISIIQQEYKEIEFRKKEKEYLSREKCSRFEIMDI